MAALSTCTPISVTIRNRARRRRNVMTSIVLTVRMLHAGHRAAEQRCGHRKPRAASRHLENGLRRRAPRREPGMPDAGAIGAVRHMVEFGVAVFIGGHGPRRV